MRFKGRDASANFPKRRLRTGMGFPSGARRDESDDNRLPRRGRKREAHVLRRDNLKICQIVKVNDVAGLETLELLHS